MESHVLIVDGCTLEVLYVFVELGHVNCDTLVCVYASVHLVPTSLIHIHILSSGFDEKKKSLHVRIPSIYRRPKGFAIH